MARCKETEVITQDPIHICRLCGKEADLRTCKIDEDGSGVHEDCYVLKVTLLASSRNWIVRSKSPATTRAQNPAL